MSPLPLLPPQPPSKPLAQQFLEIHMQCGGLQPYSLEILQRMVKMITRIGQMLVPFMKIQMLHWPEDEPTMRTVRWYTDCLLQGCAAFKKHYEARRDRAKDAQYSLPCLCFDEEPDKASLYLLTKLWTVTMKELHQPTGNDVRMWKHISNHFEDCFYHEFLTMRECDTTHAMGVALHVRFMNISLAFHEVISTIREADSIVTSLDRAFAAAQAKYALVIQERHMRRTLSSVAPFIAAHGRMLLAKEATKREATERLQAMRELPTTGDGPLDETLPEPKACTKCFRTPKTSIDASLTSNLAGNLSAPHPHDPARDWIGAADSVRSGSVSASFSQVEEAVMHKGGHQLGTRVPGAGRSLARRCTGGELLPSQELGESLRHVPFTQSASGDIHADVKTHDFARGKPLVSPQDEPLPSPATLLERSHAVADAETNRRHRMVDGDLIHFRHAGKGRAKTLDHCGSVLEDWLSQSGNSRLEQPRSAAQVRQNTL